MARRIVNKLSFANVMSVIAIFVVIGGTAYAGKKLNGKTLKRNSVAASKLKCPGAAPTRLGATCYSGPQSPQGWISATSTCRSLGLRLPSNGEGLLVTGKAGGETWADDIIVEGPNGAATSIQNGVVVFTPITQQHTARCVTVAG